MVNIQIMPELCKYKEIGCVAAGKKVYYGSCLGCKHEGDKPIERKNNETPGEKRIRISQNRRRLKKTLKKVSRKSIAKAQKSEEELLKELSDIIGG